MRLLFLSSLFLLVLFSFTFAVFSTDCCALTPNYKQPLDVKFVPSNIADYNVSCRLFDIYSNKFYGPFPIPSNGHLDLNNLPGMTSSDILCPPKLYNLVCTQIPMCSNGGAVYIPNLVFNIKRDESGFCVPVLAPPTSNSNSWFCLVTSECDLLWSSYVDISTCGPSPTPSVITTVSPTPIIVSPSPSPTPIVTTTPTPVVDTSTPTPTLGGGGSGGGSGNVYIGSRITACNAHFPSLAGYSCTIKNLQSTEVSALSLCNSEKNFACTSAWTLPGNLACNNDYEIDCTKSTLCLKDLQLKDFSLKFKTSCSSNSQVEACVISGDCVLGNSYHKTEKLISSSFDSTYCGFSGVFQKTTSCSSQNDALIKKDVSTDLKVIAVPYSNSQLNDIFGSQNKAVGVGNNSFDQNALKGSEVKKQDLQSVEAGSDLSKINANSGQELQKLGGTFQFLFYKLLPIVGVLSLVGLCVFLFAKRKLVIFRVSSKSVSIKNATVFVSCNGKTYSEVTDGYGYAKFHLPISEDEELRVQAIVNVENYKLASKLYEITFDSKKELQETLIFDEKSTVVT